MFTLEKRPSPSRFWPWATPVVAVMLTMIAGGIMFAILGKNPFEAIRTIFWDPLFNAQFACYSRPQLLVKAGPLILIAIGLVAGVPGRDLEHRGRRAIHHGGHLWRGRGAGVLSRRMRWYIFPLMVVAGRFGGWALGDDPGDPEDTLQHQ